ncbi:hypothetical protein [Schaalia suimastitidis]|uniref:hypothetical protein n=1 Tax=Schaalia suimastitidis TaxID=121163 RepID=UPI00040CA6E1|nr:hypothetical protein [Schaalia suimastitidis]
MNKRPKHQGKILPVLRRALRGTPPVNKGLADGGGILSTGSRAGIDRGTSAIPQLSSPAMIAGAAVAAVGVGAAVKGLKSSRRAGRSTRMRDYLEHILGGFALPLGWDVRLAHVEMHEGFGKPALAEIDVFVSRRERTDSDDAVLRRLLDTLIEAAWDNREIAPVSVRMRLLDAHDGEAVTLEGDILTLADATALGFSSTTATPPELYEHYGSPASDRYWHP